MKTFILNFSRFIFTCATLNAQVTLSGALSGSYATLDAAFTAHGPF